MRAFFLVTETRIDKDRVVDVVRQFHRPTVTVASALAGLPHAQERPTKYIDDEDDGTVSNHFSMRHSNAVKLKISKIAPGSGPMSYRRLHPTRQSNTLFSGHRAPPAHFSEPRSITVREACRLQGFPDSFRVYGSFANQMEQVTNAVPPQLAQAVMAAILDQVPERK
jgi:DNA (cytosine-5)-methyltransferase 1